MNLNLMTVDSLRKMAFQGASILSLIHFLNDNIEGGVRDNRLLTLRYFMKAFDLNLSELRILEGAECMGNSAYTNQELEDNLLALIAKK